MASYRAWESAGSNSDSSDVRLKFVKYKIITSTSLFQDLTKLELRKLQLQLQLTKVLPRNFWKLVASAPQLITSVAEPEPPGAATLRVNPEPIFVVAGAESRSRLF